MARPLPFMALRSRLPGAVRATVLFAVGLVWSRGVGLAMVPVLTAHLAPGDFGRLELLTSAAEIGGLMVGAGLVETLFRFASPAHAEGRRAAADVTGLALALALAFLVLAWGLAGPLARGMPLPTPVVDIRLLALLIAMDAVIGVPLGWMRMASAAGRHALASGLRATVQAMMVAILLVQGLGVTGVLAGGAAAAGLAAIVLVIGQARETGIAAEPSQWPRLMIYGGPLLGTGIASFVLGSADRWLLAGSVDAAALGQYALAMRFAMIAAMLMQPFDMWWYARRMALLEAADGLARSARAIRIGVAGIATGGALTAALGPMLIAWLAPSSYAPAMAMAPWLVLALSVQMLSSLVNVGCYVGRTTTLPLAVNAAAAAVALGLYLVLIPRLGVNGAIAATVAAQIVRLALFVVLAQRRVRIDLPYAATGLLSVLAIGAGSVPQALGTGGAAIGVSAIGVLATAAAALLTVRRFEPGAAGPARSA